MSKKTENSNPKISPAVMELALKIGGMRQEDQFALLEQLREVRVEMDKKVGAGVERLTTDAALARELIENSNYGLQRDRRKPYVKKLAREMTSGQWLSLSMIQIITHVPSGKKFLIDGQNRLAAIMASDTVQELLVIRRYVQTMEEVRQIYIKTDRGYPRRPIDIFRALRYGMEEYNLEKFGQKEHPLTEREQGLAKSVVSVMMQGFHTVSTRNGGSHGNKLNEEELLMLIDQITPAVLGYLACVSGTPHERRYLSSPVMSLGVATFLGGDEYPTLADEAQRKAATNFWTTAAHMTATEGSTPWMVSEVIKNNLSDQTGVGVLSRMLAHIWNKYRNKEKPAAVPVASDYDHQDMLRIIGSPWTGRDRVFLDLSGVFKTETQRQREVAEEKARLAAEKAAARQPKVVQTTLDGQIAAAEIDAAEARFAEVGASIHPLVEEGGEEFEAALPEETTTQEIEDHELTLVG